MALTSSEADALRAAGIFVPNDNSDPIGNGDGTSGGVVQLLGASYSTQKPGWRKALLQLSPGGEQLSGEVTGTPLNVVISAIRS